MKKCIVCQTILLLGGLGALNWGLVALFDINLVALIPGITPLISKIVYTIIGLAGLMLLVMLVKPCPCCKKPK